MNLRMFARRFRVSPGAQVGQVTSRNQAPRKQRLADWSCWLAVVVVVGLLRLLGTTRLVAAM